MYSRAGSRFIYLFTLGLFLMVSVVSLAQPVESLEQIQIQENLLIQDLTTSSFLELILWHELLGLTPRGNRDALIQSLLTYYGLNDAERLSPSSQQNRPIDVEITQAQDLVRSQFPDNQRTLLLTGNVRVVFFERESNSIHRIEAQRVFIDEENNLLVAEGGLRYTLQSGDRSEEFAGEKLYFQMDDWNGIFIEGASEQVSLNDERPVFRYWGEEIRRSPSDIIRLSNGVVTSSRWEPPAFSIRAKELMVLGPGEWSLVGGTLYLGNIPLVGIPGFFYPGRELFFHPSFGSELYRGDFIQTTTYLLGRKQREESLFDFLRFSDNDQMFRQEIRGLFLQDTDLPWENPQNTELKLMADAYTRLGFHLGLGWNLENQGIVRYFRGYLGIALTRVIYGNSGLFSSFFFDEQADRFERTWAKPIISNVTLPLRFGINLDAAITLGRFSWNIAIPAFSDPLYESDILERSESINWAQLLGLGTGGDFSTPSGPRRTLFWQSNLRGSIPLPSTRGLIQSIQINRLSQELVWRSIPLESDSIEPQQRGIPNSPGTTTYVVSTVSPLRFDGGFSGVLYPLQPDSRVQFPHSQTAAPNSNQSTGDSPSDSPASFIEEPNIDPELRRPWPEETPTEQIQDEIPLRQSELFQLAQPQQPSTGSHDLFRLTYDLTTGMEIQGFGNPINEYDPTIETPRFQYWQRSNQLRFNLRSQLQIIPQRVNLENSLSFQVIDREPFDLEPTLIPDPVTLESRVRGSNTMSITNLNVLQLTPFDRTSLLSNSRVSYTFQPVLYDRRFSSYSIETGAIYEDNIFQWEPDFVRQHSISGTLDYRPLPFRTSLTTNLVLPPRQEELTGNWSLFYTDQVQFTLAGGVTFLDDRSSFNPLVLTLMLSPWEFFRWTNTFQYEIENNHPLRYQTTLSLGPLQSSLTFDYQKPQEFTIGDGWVRVGEEQFLPTTFTLSLRDRIDPEPLWKNRIYSRVDYNLAFQQGLQRITDSVLTFQLGITLAVFEFLDLQFSSRSSNERMFLYFPFLTNRLQSEGFTPVNRNFFLDLARSFNFFSTEDRIASNFNLNSLAMNLVHYMGDWNIETEFRVNPIINDQRTSYIWDSRFTIMVSWLPIPEISRGIRVDRDGLIQFEE
jgi:hypothetical protein